MMRWVKCTERMPNKFDLSDVNVMHQVIVRYFDVTTMVSKVSSVHINDLRHNHEWLEGGWSYEQNQAYLEFHND